MVALRRSMRRAFSVIFFVWLLVPLCFAGRLRYISRQKLEVKKHLKRLKLSRVRSPDGDYIDCIHISHQPAFDHPLLKNHTIKLRPSYHPEGLFDIKKVSSTLSSPLEQVKPPTVARPTSNIEPRYQ